MEAIDAAIAAYGPVTPATRDNAPYRYENGSLYLNGTAVPMFFFGDNPEEPWFKAKPIHDFLGTTTITTAMARVHVDDKDKLQNLIVNRGNPTVIIGLAFDKSHFATRNSQESRESVAAPTEHSELSAWYVNESGLYCIIMGSEKAIAKPFQRWVTSAVLPSIRRTGRYDGSEGEPAPKRGRADDVALAEHFEDSRRGCAGSPRARSRRPCPRP
jgi:prophage antirepressor-like protein